MENTAVVEMCSGAVAHGRDVLPGFFSKYETRTSAGVSASGWPTAVSPKRTTCA